MKTVIALLIAIVLIAAIAVAGEEDRMYPETVFDYVCDAGTYTELDYDLAEEYWKKSMTIDGGCSAIAKTLANGDTVVGRNMDLSFSYKPAYIVRTKVPGCYETVGVGYIPFDGADFAEVREKGIDNVQYKMLPFRCTDVLNSAGLYVEINMRSGETDENGELIYRCTGTNPDSGHRVCSISLVRYIGEHCGTVAEVKDYLNTLDIYTPDTDMMNWNFCFLVADASGDRAVIEIARNKISFLEGESAQTNFYLTPEFAETEKLGAGYGRYDRLTSLIGDVESEEDMAELMDSVAYFSMYTDDCKFDMRSELVGILPEWTAEYVLDEANADEIDAYVRHLRETVPAKSFDRLAADGNSWQSVFTEVANCSARTLTVRFFEDDAKTVTLGF